MEQLREVLKEVLQEELTPIRVRLDAIQVQLDRIEQAQTEDVVALLRSIDKKITERTDRHEHQINLLNNRLLAVEADVRKLQLK